MAQKPKITILGGGLDLVTQPFQIGDGFCIGAQNYEPVKKGYRRVDGWEAFDGRVKPSEAAYWILGFDSGSTGIAEGDTVTGGTSGATGTALQGGTLETGTYGGGDAAGELVLYDVVGTFVDDEALEVSAVEVATANGEALQDAADDDATSYALEQAAIEKRRVNIEAVPGSGSILGVFSFEGDTYAFRNNAGGTAAVMHKSTSAGWVEQDLGKTLDFTSGGTTAISAGSTITGATSGATAVVERVVLTNANLWGDGDAEGYLVLSGQTGTFVAENLDVGASPNLATIAGDSDDVTLPAGGSYHTASHNFFGLAGLKRVYGCNGVGYAFEWDGAVWCPIRTGAVSEALDKPRYLFIQANHLFLVYDGGAILFSGTGLPRSFITTDGAGEFGLGEDPTGALSNSRTSAVITGKNKVAYLTGTDSTNFDLRYISEDSGAVANTLASIDQPHFLDDLGIRSLSAADSFGDWNVGTMSDLVEPFIKLKREAGIVPVGAMRVRGKAQYRLIYEDGTGLIVYVGTKKPQIMPVKLDFTPTCLHSGEGSNGVELLFMGSDDGFVYQIDAGTSANGEAIEAYIRLPFNHQGSPNMNKRYHRAIMDVVGAGPENSLYYSADFSYGDPDLPSSVESQFAIQGGGGFWGIADWDSFNWDARDQSKGLLEIDGLGENVSIVVMSDATYEKPHTLTSLTINYTPRRRIR